MKQGVLTAGRVRLLLSEGHTCYRPRRAGERKRKSVRGCIVSADLSILNLIIVKKGPKDIDGLTTESRPRTHVPKRASKIRKLMNLSKKDDVRQYVIRKERTGKNGKTVSKAPKIQRLITPERVSRKYKLKAAKAAKFHQLKKDAEVYNALVKLRHKEQAEKRHALLSKKRSLSRKLSESRKVSEKKATA